MKTSQYNEVLRHLKKKPITTIEAFEKYRITRLSSLIYNMRAKGMLIESIDKISKETKKRYVVYKLRK